MTARRKDAAAWDRVCLVLADDECSASLTHAQVAARAGTTYEVVRAVRRDLGQVRKTPERATPIGARLLRSMEPRHVAALQRLAAAQRQGSDMRVRAVLAGVEMQQLLTAAREAGSA